MVNASKMAFEAEVDLLGVAVSEVDFRNMEAAGRLLAGNIGPVMGNPQPEELRNWDR